MKVKKAQRRKGQRKGKKPELKSGLLVGIEVTDPTTALENEVHALQKRVDERRKK